MEKLRSSGAGSGQQAEQQQQQLEQYPKNAIEQYLRASTKIKKIERVVFFKRFAPNVADVQADFQRLAYNFEESGIMQYAAMCHIGYAKCASYGGASQTEAEAYIRAARAFLLADSHFRLLHFRSAHNGFRQGALHCYNRAAERVADAGVFKAAALRELQQQLQQPQLERTSSFASPTHQIHDLELNAELSMTRGDFRAALQQLDDIVDNVYERRVPLLYGDLLRRVEVLRLLLLVHLNLPPARQSPSHIKLIEYYYNLAQLAEPCLSFNNEPVERAGAFVPVQQQNALAEILCAWVERKMCDLKQLLLDFGKEFRSISQTERQLLETIHAELSKVY